MYSFDIIKIP